MYSYRCTERYLLSAYTASTVHSLTPVFGRCSHVPVHCHCSIVILGPKEWWTIHVGCCDIMSLNRQHRHFLLSVSIHLSPLLRRQHHTVLLHGFTPLRCVLVPPSPLCLLAPLTAPSPPLAVSGLSRPCIARYRVVAGRPSGGN